MKTEFPKITSGKDVSGSPFIITSDLSKIAWMAAIVEGEGYIAPPQSKKGGKSYSGLKIRVVMCDLDVLERFFEYAGGGRIDGPYEPNSLGKKKFYIYTASNAHCYELLTLFWQWMGERRKAQIRKAVTKWGDMKTKSDGVILVPSQIADIRDRLKTGYHGIGKQLAAEYGVSGGMISAIKHNRAWKGL